MAQSIAIADFPVSLSTFLAFRRMNILSHCYIFSINFIFDISLVSSVILSKKTVYSIVISDFVFVLGHVRVIGICNQFRF